MPNNNLFQPSFWDDEMGGMWDDLAETLILIYLSGAEGGVAALPLTVRVLANFDLINTNVMDFARKYRYEWVKGIVDTTRLQVQKAVGDWVQSGSPLDALKAALEPVFGEKRAERIAVTEVTRVFAQGNQAAWESTGIVEEMVWQTVNDDLTCPICSELDGTHIGVGDIDAIPPAHPRCRCYLLPVVSSEAVEGKLDEILG